MKRNKTTWLLPFIVIIMMRSCNAIRKQETGESRYSRYKARTTSSQIYNNNCTPMLYYDDKGKNNYDYNDNFYAVREYACLKESYPLYDWYRDDMCVIGYCEKNQIVYVSSTNGDYSHVFTSDNVDGYIPNSMLEYVPEEYLDQDISEQFVKVLKR